MQIQKDSNHTAQQWHLYWEERVRPRYLRRKAKQTRRASPEMTIPARSQIPISPKKTVAAPPSTFSPFKTDHSPKPELPQKTISEVQNPTSPQMTTVALPSTLSPISKSYFSPSVERHYSLKPAARSLSYHPELPTLKTQQVTDVLSLPMPSLPSNNDRHTPRTPEKIRSPHHETLKRKHVAIEEALPSSSPLGPISPKRRRPSASELPLEIASTPEKKREPDTDVSYSPLFISLELEEDDPSLPEDSSDDGPLGQQLSDTLSEAGRVVNYTQAVFGDATQLIDFDIPAPEGGWDDEELVVQNPSRPVSFDVPPPEDGRKDNKHGIRESTQQIDFDLLPPKGGWDEEEIQVKEESKSPSMEIRDSQPTLPDTQAILRDKTPAPDFSIPDPDGGWNSVMTSSPPLIPNSPRAESVFSQTDLKEQMDAWIDARAINGISVEQVESVLKSTSMDTTLADKALRHLAKRGVLPKDRRGIWTESDDEDLKSTDARKIQRLQERHGADGLTARWEFLDFYAEEA